MKTEEKKIVHITGTEEKIRQLEKCIERALQSRNGEWGLELSDGSGIKIVICDKERGSNT